jgi:hypothetical protein
MTTKQNPLVATLKTFSRSIKHFFRAVWAVILVIANLIKSFFVAIEKTLKMIAIFIIAISASVLFLTTSLYLLSAAFGIKESPAFKEVRDRATQIYSLSAQNELDETEAHVRAEIQAEQEAENNANNHQK